MYAILHGNPIDGFNLFGPFDSNADAIDAADKYSFIRHDDWYVMEIEPPGTDTDTPK